jgi:hypothetical protein
VAFGRGGQRNFRAAGRLKPGEMNKTETAYAKHLEAEKAAGRIVWWKFEAIKLRLANRSFLTMDFAVLVENGGVLELHDSKGAKHIVTEDARLKVKLAAEAYPFVFKFAYPRKAKDGGGWEIEEI